MLLVRLSYELSLSFLADSRQNRSMPSRGRNRLSRVDKEGRERRLCPGGLRFVVFFQSEVIKSSRRHRDVDERSPLAFCCVHKTKPFATRQCPRVIKSCLASPVKYRVTGDPVETSATARRISCTHGINHAPCFFSITHYLDHQTKAGVKL